MQQQLETVMFRPLLGWWKEGADRQDEVEGAQEESFEPGGFAVQADERVEPSHQAKHRHFQQREVEVERHADEWTGEYKDGRGQQGDLDRGASGNGHRDLHVIVGGRGDGGVVLSSVAYDRQNDEADKKGLRPIWWVSGSMVLISAKRARQEIRFTGCPHRPNRVSMNICSYFFKGSIHNK